MTHLRGHVLIVDDLEGNRCALARILQKEGLVTEEAWDGEDALEKVKTGAYDLILLDVMMPGMGGIECLRQLKSDSATNHIPVLMLSALNEAHSVQECIRLGADDYLPKPVDLLLLHARLVSSLGKKEFRDKERDYLIRLEAANEELRRLNQLKSRILAIAAHDLKNPMTTINLLVEQMLDASMEGIPLPQLRRSAQRIQDSNQKMLGILQALLDTAAFEAGQFVIRKRMVDLGALAQAVIEENRTYSGLSPTLGPTEEFGSGLMVV